jgi:hypothetical protein
MEAFAAAAGGMYKGGCFGFSLFGFGSPDGIVLAGIIVLITETPYRAKY